MDPQELFARLRSSASALSPRQLATLGLAFVSVVGITIASAYWLNRPDYRVLMSDMDPGDAQSLVSRLEAEKQEYQLAAGGRTVLVPAANVDALLLKVAGDGMPRSGSPAGWELFDEVRFGVTNTVEEINRNRALEGEISRTLASIREVAGARVHLAIPKDSVFTQDEKDEPTAAVTLKLRQNLKLPPSTIRAITALVAASVSRLRPEKVVVMDDFGRPLSMPSEDEDGAAGPPMERQLGIERELAMKTVAMLEPIVGAGHVRVNVTARMSTATEEKTAETIDPNVIAVRQEASVMQASGGGAAGGAGAGGAGGGGGVAGVRNNLPTPAPAGGGVAPPQTMPVVGPGASQSQSLNRTYEINKTVTHTVQPQGQIARLSVAVLVDDNHTPPAAGTTGPPKTAPRTPEQMTLLRKLVEGSVGFDAQRGDQIMVENIAFEQPPVEPIVELPAWQRYQEQGFEALRIFGVVAIALLAILMVIRPMVRRSLPPPVVTPVVTAGGAVQARTVQDIEAELDSEFEAVMGSAASKKLPVLTKRATAFTDKEPENAARLVRAWLTEEER